MSAGSRGRQSESPLEAFFQPWELVGESRRDCEPHRGRLLHTLAYVGLLAGGLSFLCPPVALLGLPLGLVARTLARRDLDMICAGHVDQRGYHPTEKARSDAQAAVVLNLLGSLVWLALGVLLCLRLMIPRD